MLSARKGRAASRTSRTLPTRPGPDRTYETSQRADSGLSNVFDDSDEFLEPVAVLSRETDELLRAYYDRTLLGSTRDGHAPPTAEVKQAFIA